MILAKKWGFKTSDFPLITTVSYTHLDVYKRQIQNRSQCGFGVTGSIFLVSNWYTFMGTLIISELHRRSINQAETVVPTRWSNCTHTRSFNKVLRRMFQDISLIFQNVILFPVRLPYEQHSMVQSYHFVTLIHIFL